MNDITMKALDEAGINYVTGINRFLDDEEMYFEFLVQFLDDDLVGELEKSVAAGDVKTAFDRAHTLKGVCANLSIDSINDIVNPMVEVLRAQSFDGVTEKIASLRTQYEKVADTIREYCV